MNQIKKSLEGRKLPDKIMENEILCGAFESLRFIGFIVTESQSNLHYVKGLFFLTCFVIFMAGQFWQTFVNTDNIPNMSVYVTFGFHLFSISIRVIDFYVKQPKFYGIIRELHEDLEVMTEKGNDQEKKIIKDTKTYAKIVTFFLLKSSRLSAVLLIIMHFVLAKYNPLNILKLTMIPPFLGPQWPIPKSGWGLYLLNIFNWNALVMAVAIIPTWHYFMSILPLFAVLNFKILNHRLRNLQDYIVGETKVDRCKQAHSFFAETIKRHIYIKNYLDELQDLSGVFLFLDFIVYSIQLCFMLFQITKATDVGLLIFNVNYVSTLVVVLFLYYYHGNEVVIHSNLITTAIYESNWYEYDLKFRTSMLQIMTNSYEPSKLYAGFIELSLENFIAIVKSAYSYFTLLNAVSV